MTRTPDAAQLAKEIGTLRREVKGLSRGNQGGFRSLDGRSIPIYDSGGSFRGSIGQLSDGTTGFEVVAGPKPVAPSAPILFPTIGGLEIEWNGDTSDGSALPGDFRCVEVHASPYPVYTPDETTLRANLIRPATITLSLPAQAWTVCFVIRTTADVLSDPSIGATETPEHAPTAAEVSAARSVAESAQSAAEAADARALAAAGIAEGKGKVYYQTAPPAADVNGLWIDTDGGNKPHRWDGDSWEPVQDAGIQAAASAAAAAQGTANTALEQAQAATSKADQALLDAESAAISANGKNHVFWRASSNPPPSPLIDGDLWFVTDLGNRPRIREAGEWKDATLQDGAIAGLNVGKLTSGSIAVGQRIIAGLINGTHAEMSDDGFRVYLEDPVDGTPDEIVRMGTGTDDILGISDRNGTLVASMDQTGSVNARTANFRQDIVVSGKTLETRLREAAGGVVTRFSGQLSADLGPIQSRVGIAEISAVLSAGRVYELNWRCTWKADDTGAEVRLKIMSSIGAEGSSTATPALVSSFDHETWERTAEMGTRWVGDQGSTLLFPTVNSRHRYLLAIEKGLGTGSLHVVSARRIELWITDLGRIPIDVGNFAMGGGSLVSQPPPPPPPSVQSYFVDLAPAGWNAYRGDGVLRTDVPGPVQGRDPGGYNGDGKGHWYFPMPSITGNITNMEFYAYANHTYYNDGGDVLIFPTVSGNGGPNYDYAAWAPHPAGRWPKPGGRTIQLPSSWWPLYKNGGNGDGRRADGVRVGPGGADLRNYVRFDGGSARLRIWYTQ